MRIFTLTDTHLHPEIDYHAFCNCAHENSGNFYDFIPQEGSRLTVSFGDLPPTGDVPSITIPCLRALVRGLTAGSRGDLDGLARELNGTLYLLGPRDLCAPWFCALVDPVRHELRYVNAGHEPPLLIRNHGGTNHGGTVERLERPGAVLGLSARGPHRQETTAIEAGDILAVFSEGVSDALPGVRLQDVILEHSQTGAAGLTGRVLEEAHRAASRTWPDEDRTFAAMRVVGACQRPLAEESAVESLAMCAA